MLALIKVLSFIFTKLNPEVSLYIARVMGRIYYFLDRRHRLISYRNLRLALSEKLTPEELRKILKLYYINMAQNFVEVLYMPKINASYIRKYIKIEGQDYIKKFAKAKRGVILTTAHFGNWEISNIICKYLLPDSPYIVLARDQIKIKRLEQLLNLYREMHGFKVISTNSRGLRQALINLKKGAFLGMVIDQGIGSSDVFIDFFNHRVPAPTGAVKLSLQFGSPLILGYIRRIKGPYLSLKITPAFESRKDSSNVNQIQENVQELNKAVEGFISQFPADYLWQFKRFKNRIDRNILILNDAKAGHLRQAEAVAGILLEVLRKKGLAPNLKVINVEFKSEFTKMILTIILNFFNLSLALRFARGAFLGDSFQRLISTCPDFVISAGNSSVCVNLMLSRENKAKSILIMRPSLFSLKSFNLAIVPRHDRIRPRRNVLAISGAPNLIDESYLEKNSKILSQRFAIDNNPKRLKIGLLLGGDTKDFRMTRQLTEVICEQILSVALKNNAQILISTSRRTPTEVQVLLKEKFINKDLTKALIIANENNIPEAVGGILGLCQIIVVSGDSISMVSEAASSGKYIIVFRARGMRPLSKHERFLFNLAQDKYIYLSDSKIGRTIEELWLNRPPQRKLEDRQLITEALEKII